MRSAFTVIALFASLTVSPAFAADAAKTRTYTFENDAVGAPPADFEFARTGQGAEGKWTVELERGEKNHVLLQSSGDKTDYRFPVAVVKNESLHDVTLTVRARPLEGEVDQGFGLVWRYRDVNNYYLTRCNADEDNCTIYHVIDGSRRAFQNRAIKVCDPCLAHLEDGSAGQSLHRLVRWTESARRAERHPPVGAGRPLVEGGLGDRVRRLHHRAVRGICAGRAYTQFPGTALM